MTPLDLTSPKDLVHLFVDGEINDVQRTMLFRELADNSELQEYLSDVMQTEQRMEQYRATATVPDALRSAIFAQAGFGTTAPTAAPAVAGAFWRYGIAMSIGAAILTGGFSFNSTHSAPEAITSTPTSVRSVESLSLPTAPSPLTTTANRPTGLAANPAAVAATNAHSTIRKTILNDEQDIQNKTFSRSSEQPQNTIAAPVETANSLATPESILNIQLGGTARSESPVARFGKQPGTNKDISVLLGGFGSTTSPSEPTRLAAMYIVNDEVSFGAQYATRSYNLTALSDGSVQTNPTVTGFEGIFQYTENSDILPLNMKPVFSGAVGYNRLGPTAFMFMGVSSEQFDILTLQAGVEGNLLIYNSNGSHSIAGGGRFTINAGIRF